MQDEQHECLEAAKSRHLVNAVHWPGIIQQSFQRAQRTIARHFAYFVLSDNTANPTVRLKVNHMLSDFHHKVYHTIQQKKTKNIVKYVNVQTVRIHREHIVITNTIIKTKLQTQCFLNGLLISRLRLNELARVTLNNWRMTTECCGMHRSHRYMVYLISWMYPQVHTNVTWRLWLSRHRYYNAKALCSARIWRLSDLSILKLFWQVWHRNGRSPVVKFSLTITKIEN